MTAKRSSPGGTADPGQVGAWWSRVVASVRSRAWWGRLLGAVGSRLFAVTAGIVLVLLLLYLGKLVLYGDGGAGLVTAVAALALLAAFCVQFGTTLAHRVRKLGPVELFEERISGALERLRELRLESSPDLSGSPLSRAEKLDYERLDALIDYLEGTDRRTIETSSGLLRTQYYRLLFYVGRTAARQGDWARAIERLERLQELARGDYEPVNTPVSIGWAALSWAGELEAANEGTRKERRDLWEKAVEQFELATRRKAHNHLAFYFLAIAQHKLGHFRPAVRSNLRVLRLRHEYAPAKYNEVVGWVGLKRFNCAYRRLQGIEVDDENAKEVFEVALTDKDLEPLRKHPELGPLVIQLLQDRTQGP